LRFSSIELKNLEIDARANCEITNFLLFVFKGCVHKKKPQFSKKLSPRLNPFSAVGFSNSQIHYSVRRSSNIAMGVK